MERQYTYSHIRAVWNATIDEVAQRTVYYPSGVPMAQSTGQSMQSLKYNAHEYIETHGYDTYDYGFRGYYATIGRFTSIDPLCERTPWQSPYAYANNNWVNQIDYVGLFGMNKDVLGCNFTVVDKDYKVIYHDDDHGNGVYMWQEDEDFKLEENGDIPWSMLSFLGFELPYATYFKGRTCLYMVVDINHGGYGAKPYVSAQIMKGNRLASYGDLLEWVIRLPPSVKLLYSLALGGIESSILKNMDPQVTPYASRVFAIGENVNGISTYIEIAEDSEIYGISASRIEKYTDGKVYTVSQNAGQAMSVYGIKHTLLTEIVDDSIDEIKQEVQNDEQTT